jgi:hypothetical protein
LSSGADIREGQILTGPLFSEPMRVETVRADGPDAWVAGVLGLRSEQFRRVTLRQADLAGLTITDTSLSYDGDGRLLRLALQAYSLGIAYEFDPYFGLSISRVDPLPHQLEAVYEGQHQREHDGGADSSRTSPYVREVPTRERTECSINSFCCPKGARGGPIFCCAV